MLQNLIIFSDNVPFLNRTNFQCRQMLKAQPYITGPGCDCSKGNEIACAGPFRGECRSAYSASSADSAYSAYSA